MKKLPELPPIHVLRGQRVIFDSDLAALYGVSIKVFNQSIARNLNRFPPDFIFQLTDDEFANLRSQIVTSSVGVSAPSPLRSQIVTLKTGKRGRHRKYRPWVFTNTAQSWPPRFCGARARSQ
jgi:hypothetical protein